MNPDQIEQYLYEHIPMSGHMKIRVQQVNENGLILTAPLGPNINHRNTAFGGSVSTLAILAGWTWIHMNLRKTGFNGKIVIQNNRVDYLKPITDTFSAFCPASIPKDWEHFTAMIERHGKGRLDQDVSISQNGMEAGKFSGRYVALSN